MTTVTFEAHDFLFGWPITVDLEAGIVNDEAIDVFRHGQCHSLAIAIAQHLGGSVSVMCDGDEWHCLATAGGVFFDITGTVDPDDFGETVATVDPTEKAVAEVLGDDFEDWHPFQVEDARSFALAVLADTFDLSRLFSEFERAGVPE